MRLGKYIINNTSGSATQRDKLTVFLDGVIMASVRTGHSNPLKYIRMRPLEPVRQGFVRQLRANNVPEDDVQMILSLDNKLEKD